MDTTVLTAIIYTVGFVVTSFMILSHLKRLAELDSETKVERERLRTNADMFSSKAEAGALNYGNESGEVGMMEKIITSVVTSNPEIVAKLVSGITKKQ